MELVHLGLVKFSRTEGMERRGSRGERKPAHHASFSWLSGARGLGGGLRGVVDGGGWRGD